MTKRRKRKRIKSPIHESAVVLVAASDAHVLDLFMNASQGRRCARSVVRVYGRSAQSPQKKSSEPS